MHSVLILFYFLPEMLFHFFRHAIRLRHADGESNQSAVSLGIVHGDPFIDLKPAIRRCSCIRDDEALISLDAIDDNPIASLIH